MLQNNRRARLLRLAVIVVALLAAGILYAWFAGHVAGIPCMFHLLTGLKCPGCGMTRVLISLLQGDLIGAFRQNAAVFLLLPLGSWFAVLWTIRYIRTGSKKTGKLENVLLWIMVVSLLVFGVLRNLVGI